MGRLSYLMRKAFFTIVFILSFLGSTGCSSKKPPREHKENEFFLTAEERKTIKAKTKNRIKLDELNKWDTIANTWIERRSIEGADIVRLFAYLYKAQNAFVEESYAITGDYSGSLDSISGHVLHLFFPDYQNIEPIDTFSRDLTMLLAQQIDLRFYEENLGMHPVNIVERADSWHLAYPIGLKIPTMKPWVLKSASEYRVLAPPPPEAGFWQDQLAEVKRSMGDATAIEKERILFWAGIPPGSGDWNTIAEQYMSKIEIKLSKRLEIRATLATAIVDADIAAFDSKYAYLVRRPYMLDPALKTVIPTPGHPSYPAAHATIAAAIQTLLQHYFPENQEEWEKLAQEASRSRVQAGVHFPIDIKAGKEQGINVGKAFLPPSS